MDFKQCEKLKKEIIDQLVTGKFDSSNTRIKNNIFTHKTLIKDIKELKREMKTLRNVIGKLKSSKSPMLFGEKSSEKYLLLDISSIKLKQTELERKLEETEQRTDRILQKVRKRVKKKDLQRLVNIIVDDRLSKIETK